MSNIQPLDYLDTASEIMDEMELKERPLHEVIERLELEVMEEALVQCVGNVRKAAELTRINRTTFYQRISTLRARYGQG